MPSRIRIGGRVLGSGTYGDSPLCICGDPVAVLGRCLACHEALRRRRLGLPPASKAEGKRLAGYLEKYQSLASKCAECGAVGSEDHDKRCSYADD